MLAPEMERSRESETEAEDLELARQFVETYNAREIDRLASICHAEVEARSLYAGLESGGVFRGRDGFPYSYFAAIDEAWDYFLLLDPRYEHVGDRMVLIHCTMSGRGRASGLEVREPIFVLWKMRDGKLWMEETLTDESVARDRIERWR